MGTTVGKEVFLWVQNSRGMTSMIVCGNCLSHTFRGSADSGEELLRITGGLSTVCFGFYAPEHHGVICRHAMGNGVLYISASADGEIRAFGKSYWKFWWMNRILNG